jgi:hypothetical protein
MKSKQPYRSHTAIWAESKTKLNQNSVIQGRKEGDSCKRMSKLWNLEEKQIQIIQAYRNKNFRHKDQLWIKSKNKCNKIIENSSSSFSKERLNRIIKKHQSKMDLWSHSVMNGSKCLEIAKLRRKVVITGNFLWLWWIMSFINI